MAQDYARVHDFYYQLQELGPPAQQYHHYDLPPPGSNPSVAQAYELTTSDCGGGAQAEPPPPCTLVAQPPPSHPRHTSQEPRKRKSSHLEVQGYEMTTGDCGGSRVSDTSNAHAGHSPTLLYPAHTSHEPRKRKSSHIASGSNYEEDEAGDDSRSTSTMPDKNHGASQRRARGYIIPAPLTYHPRYDERDERKRDGQNHSEIEKRRRDKMNTYISQLSAMIPMCGAMARKLDKLTVLRMAVQHLRSVRGNLSACPLTARPKPAFLSEKELNALILQAAQNCFILVVGCDRGRLLYVSESVKTMLYYEQSELLGQSLFDILHPKDVAKVKEQLSSSDLSPRERLIDIKTMLPVKADMVTDASRLCPGARRSFFCRIKCKTSPEAVDPIINPVKEENEAANKMRKKQQHEKKYCVVQCTGYLKSWTPAEMSEGSSNANEGAEESDGSSLSCLVAVVRALPDLLPAPPSGQPSPPTRPLQYISRHATDGKFVFVDQRVTLALGFLPQELLGTSMYEYVSGPELSAIARTHKQTLLRRESLHTPPYSFRRKDNTYARIQTHFKPFRNPWTKDVECLVANNTVVNDAHHLQTADPSQTFDVYGQIGGNLSESGAVSSMLVSSDINGVTETDVEMQQLIDSQLESHKIGCAIAEEVLRSSSSEFSPDLPTDLLQDVVLNQQASLVDILSADMSGGYNQVRNNVPLSAAGAASTPPPVEVTPPPASPPLGIDGNGEAAMAVIMSLLEADAGLGGPINFSGLPWPLP